MLDGYAEHAFSHDDCAALAIALHDATVWSLVKVTDAHNVWTSDGANMEGLSASARRQVGETGGGATLHWMVRQPDGRLVDVDGAHDLDAILARFDDEADDETSALRYASRQDALEEYVEGQGKPISVALAGPS